MNDKLQVLHSSSFLKQIAIPFNGVIGKDIIIIHQTMLQIKFPNRGADNSAVIVNLMTKLREAFKAINKKYDLDLDNKKNIRLSYESEETSNSIFIRGILRVPPGKIFNLFSIILWYYILYITGDKPSSSTYGNQLTSKWKKEFDDLQYRINKLPRKLEVTYDQSPCHICGVMSKMNNVWTLNIHKRLNEVSMKTRVCAEHRQKLI